MKNLGWSASQRCGGLALMLLAAGCRYTTEGGLPASIRTIQVPVFRNRTLDRALEVPLTRAVVDRLAAGGRLDLGGPEADALLSGEIIGVGRRVTDEDAADAAVESQLEIRVRVRLIDRTGERPRVLMERVFSNRDLYLASGVIRARLGESEETERPRTLIDLGDAIGRAVLDYWPQAGK